MKKMLGVVALIRISPYHNETSMLQPKRLKKRKGMDFQDGEGIAFALRERQAVSEL
jgi:hypothetical protein